MISSLLLGVASVLVVSLISLIGLATLVVGQKRLAFFLFGMVSFAAGALLGDAFFHLLPDLEGTGGGYTSLIATYILSGIMVSFIVEKVIHWAHWHHTGEHCEESPKTRKTEHEMGFHHVMEHEMGFRHIHPVAWMNLFGDGIHNLIDGLIIGASYLINTGTGLATTAAVIFHEIPQEIGDFAVLLHAGMTRRKALFYNLLTALTAFIGLFITFAIHTVSPKLETFLVAFAAGSFIYIASSDLIPELHKEVKVQKSLLQLLFFIAGIALMYGLTMIE